VRAHSIILRSTQAPYTPNTMNEGDNDPGAADPTDQPAEIASYAEEVEVLELDGRRLVLVGTAHISRESVELVRQVIERERPDAVCIELDQRRFEALSQRKRWEALDLREVIRKRQLTTLLLNLILASYQKRLGGKLGVMPGSELLEAIEVAQACNVPVVLCDRDVRVTLRRAWGSLPLGKKAMLLSGVLAGATDSPEITEQELRKLRRKDVLSELMQELGRAMPELKRALIDERDAYLATKIRSAHGARLVAVVGAGHLAGMVEALRERRDADLTELERIPPVSPLWRALGWGLTVLIIASVVYIGATQGADAARENALIWVLAHGVPSALGGVFALAHPLTILTAFVVAPFTALSPAIGAGYVTAFVQTYVVPPRVFEFQSVGEDLVKARAWWSSRLLRVFLVFILTSVGSMLGTCGGGATILSNTF
jgi:pheromone shutdown-related protein TraB